MLTVGVRFRRCLGGLKLESDEVLEVLFDFLDDVELALTNLRNRLAKLKGVNERVWSWDPSKIKWEPAEGFRGEYERSEASITASLRRWRGIWLGMAESLHVEAIAIGFLRMAPL